MMDILPSTASAGSAVLPFGGGSIGTDSGLDFAAALQQASAAPVNGQPIAPPVPQIFGTGVPVTPEGPTPTLPGNSPVISVPAPNPMPASAVQENTAATTDSKLVVGNMPPNETALAPVVSVEAGEAVATDSGEKVEVEQDVVAENEPASAEEVPLLTAGQPMEVAKDPDIKPVHPAGPPAEPTAKLQLPEGSPGAPRTTDAAAPPLAGTRLHPAIASAAEPVRAAEQPSQQFGIVPPSGVALPLTTPAAHASSASLPEPEAHLPRLSLHDRLGAVIARRLGDGGEEVQIRMDPAELGRIHVRLSFDEGGSLRAVVAADSPQVLEAIRRDSADLGRTLTDAGVRTDAQSFRFDRGSGSGHGGDMPRQWGQQSNDRGGAASSEAEPIPDYRPLRRSGRLDLMA